MSDQEPRLGFIGTGLMGGAIVDRLISRGHAPVIWNREPYMMEPLILRGAVPASCPAEVAKRSDIVFVCVLDAKAVSDVVCESAGVCEGGAPNKILVDHSTISPGETERLAGLLHQRCGMDWVDAPISGGPPFALEGRLTVMVGGAPESYARVEPVLSEYSANRTLIGPIGAGQMAKIINQAVCGVGYVLMAEILRLAELSGIDSSQVPKCLAGGHADSTMLQVIYPRMVERQFDPPASLSRQMLKDLSGVLKEGRNLSVNLPLVSAAERRFQEYAQAGGGLSETASIYRLYNTTGQG